MTSSTIDSDSTGKFEINGNGSLELWQIRSRAYHFAQKIVDHRIAMRDAFLSAQIRFNIDPEKEVEDSFKNHNLSIGYEEHYPLKEYLKGIRDKHKKDLKNHAGN